MNKRICIFMVYFILALNLSGCGVNRDGHKDLQRLSQIDIYSEDGSLIRTVKDEDTLYQFSSLSSANIDTNTDLQQDEMHEMTDGLDILFTVIVYKTPAAIFQDGTLDKISEITLYRDSNIVKKQLAPEIIKGTKFEEEDLTFYLEASNEYIDFILSLANTDG